MNPEKSNTTFSFQSDNLDVSSHTQELPGMSKRTQAAKELIGRYFTLLTKGCGNQACTNHNCASSPSFAFSFSSNNEVAAKSLQLLSGKAPFCEEQQPKVQRRETIVSPKISSVPSKVSKPTPSESQTFSGAQSSSSPTTSKSQTQAHQGEFLDKKSLIEVIDACREANDWRMLIRTIGNAFHDLDCLQRSFVKPETSAPSSVCVAEPCSSGAAAVADAQTLDVEGLQEAYAALFAVPDQPFLPALVNGLVYSAEGMHIELRSQYSPQRHLHIIGLVLELPCISAPELLETALPAVCKAIATLPLQGQESLCRQWARRSRDWLFNLLSSLQQLMTLRVMTRTWGRLQTLQEDTHIAAAARTLKLVYYASLLGGEHDPDMQLAAEKQLEEQQHTSDMFQVSQGGGAAKERKESRIEPLERVLKVRTVDCRQPILPLSAFVNDVVNDHIDIENDFSNYRVNEDQGNSGRFCFMDHQFMLTTLTKSQWLFFDNKIRQLSERRHALLQTILQGEQHSLYLRIRVNRESIINDALVNLELIAMESPQDLKKQLYVEFEGEQGIDEGGVSKEFFQLVVEKIFNPDVGMFTYSEESRMFWFNPDSLENDAQFTLIGIVLGLAIYNNVILDVHFPPVVYRKLLGKKGTMHDLLESHPTVARSLQQVLEYDPERVEDDLMLSFCAGYSGLFDEAHMKELKPGGSEILVNGDNREEFVQLYVDFLLNDSIQRQFAAFKRGFCLVTDESPLHWLFRPDELELLIVGSRDLDFAQMEEGTDYDGGYTQESTTIKNFWSVLREFNEDQKRQFLQFTTGSDRAPIGGLSKLKLVIARHGPDSERLPSAHTCFNVLLLPDYSCREKLQERLLKAITHATGFGML